MSSIPSVYRNDQLTLLQLSLNEGNGDRGTLWDFGLPTPLTSYVEHSHAFTESSPFQNTWMISSSMIVNGLSWWQSWLCVWIGYTISATFICMTGRIGATYHISFPVVTRASFGIWGSLWPVFNRAAMACIWYGVQSWIGGKFPCHRTGNYMLKFFKENALPS